jgi:hypothetical protein
MSALAANTTGSNNTGVGYQANVAANNLTNATAIGYGALVAASNTIQLGNTDVTDVKTSGTLTAGAVTYPKVHGSANQVLSTTGSGTLAWTTVASTLPTTVNTSANYNIVMATGSNAALVTGTGNGGNAATLNPYTGQISVSGLTAQGYGITSPIYASTPQTLTDAATIAWNPLNGLNASVTLGGNRTLNFSGSLIAGSYGTLVVTQDVTGGRTLTLPSVANKVLGSTSTTTIALSTAAGAKDIVNFYYDGTNYFWNVGQGYGSASTSSTTNLASSVTGTLPVANGGTGAATLTGYLKGNGTSAMTASSTIPVSDVSGAAPLASPALTGTPTAPTAISGTNTTQVATTAFVTSESGNNGKFLTTNGSTASWASSAGVPYSGATGAVNLGNYNLTVNGVKIGTLGTDNTALQSNLIIGRDVLINNTNGTGNMAIGNMASYSNVGGNANISIGNE